MSRGRVKYVPKIIIDELENTKSEYNLDSLGDAWVKIRENSITGRELDKMKKRLFFGR